mgnify:CR=1 FL=1
MLLMKELLSFEEKKTAQPWFTCNFQIAGKY